MNILKILILISFIFMTKSIAILTEGDTFDKLEVETGLELSNDDLKKAIEKISLNDITAAIQEVLFSSGLLPPDTGKFTIFVRRSGGDVENDNWKLDDKELTMGWDKDKMEAKYKYQHISVRIIHLTNYYKYENILTANEFKNPIRHYMGENSETKEPERKFTFYIVAEKSFHGTQWEKPFAMNKRVLNVKFTSKANSKVSISDLVEQNFEEAIKRAEKLVKKYREDEEGVEKELEDQENYSEFLVNHENIEVKIATSPTLPPRHYNISPETPDEKTYLAPQVLPDSNSNYEEVVHKFSKPQPILEEKKLNREPAIKHKIPGEKESKLKRGDAMRNKTSTEFQTDAIKNLAEVLVSSSNILDKKGKKDKGKKDKDKKDKKDKDKEETVKVEESPKYAANEVYDLAFENRSLDPSTEDDSYNHLNEFVGNSNSDNDTEDNAYDLDGSFDEDEGMYQIIPSIKPPEEVEEEIHATTRSLSISPTYQSRVIDNFHQQHVGFKELYEKEQVIIETQTTLNTRRVYYAYGQDIKKVIEKSNLWILKIEKMLKSNVILSEKKLREIGEAQLKLEKKVKKLGLNLIKDIEKLSKD